MRGAAPEGRWAPSFGVLRCRSGRVAKEGEYLLFCSSAGLQHLEEEGARASRSPGFSLWGKGGPIAAGPRLDSPEVRLPVHMPEGLDGGARKEENRSPGELSLRSRRLRTT